MASSSNLLAAGLIGKIICILSLSLLYTFIEKDNKGEVLWVWSYPTIDSSLRDLLMQKCTLDHDAGEEGKEIINYIYGHLSDVWYYLYNQETKGAETLDKVCMNYHGIIMMSLFLGLKFLCGSSSKSMLLCVTKIYLIF